MATHTGDEGTVKVGSDQILEVRSFEFTEVSGTIEDTQKGDASVTRVAGRTDSNGQISCWWDQDDTTGQVALTPGAAVTLNLQIEGDATGDIQYSIPAIVTEVQHTSPEGESVSEAIFSFVQSGALTRSAL